MSTQSYPIIHPSQSIEVEEGHNLEVRCSVSANGGPPKALYWRGVWKSENEIHQEWADNFTRTLIIKNITGKDAGIYQCFYNSSTLQTKKGLSIRVISKCKFKSVTLRVNSKWKFWSHLQVQVFESSQSASFRVISKCTCKFSLDRSSSIYARKIKS